jgi:prepilin-type processing-associated H-X9-DG protein/prepilin-type N-terminal cleavage/methylation domain-containing protein
MPVAQDARAVHFAVNLISRFFLAGAMAMRHPSRAFTLVELLVVIGVIAVLIAMLLPALNRARDSANTLQCMSNLRQLGTGLVMYGNDFRGAILPSRLAWNWGTPGTQNPEWPDHWHSMLIDPERKYLPGQGELFSAGAGVYKSRPLNVLTCPNDTFGMELTDAAGRFVVMTNGKGLSYVSNRNYMKAGGSRKFVTVDRIAEALAITDGHSGDNEESMELVASQLDRLRFEGGRHAGRKRLNVLFLDGHVTAEPHSDVSNLSDPRKWWKQ